MATAEHAPMPAAEPAGEPGGSIVLQAVRGESRASITFHYCAVQELRAAVKAAGDSATGMLFGRRLEDSAAIEHCGTAARGEGPIGLFRTQSAGWPTITAEDCRRIRHALPATRSDALFLVVRTLAQRPWAATLFAVDPRQPSSEETPILEFPFDEYLLRNGWLTELTPPPEPQPRMADRPRRRGRRPWIAIAAAAALIGGGAAAYQFHWLPWPPSRGADLNDIPDLTPPEVVSPIALRVLRGVDDFAITWNRSADAVRAATAGTLTIRNGPLTRIVPVSAAQLREGHVQYRPLSGVDADFRLELMTADGKTEAESVQVLGFDTTAPDPPPARSAPQPKAPARPPERQPLQRADRTDRAGVARRAAEPPPAERTEATPIRRVNPTVTRDVLNEMRDAKRKVTVSVLVSIDAGGLVDSAKVLSSTGEASPGGQHIRLASLNAAKQWRFRPATAGGKPIPSSLTLVFSF